MAVIEEREKTNLCPINTKRIKLVIPFSIQRHFLTKIYNRKRVGEGVKESNKSTVKRAKNLLNPVGRFTFSMKVEKK